MSCHEVLELRDQIRVPSQREVGVDASLDCRNPHLREMNPIRFRERLVDDIDQSVPPKQLESIGESGDGLGHLTAA